MSIAPGPAVTMPPLAIHPLQLPVALSRKFSQTPASGLLAYKVMLFPSPGVAAGPCVVIAPPGTRLHPLHVPLKLSVFSQILASRPLTKRSNANVPEPPGRLSTKNAAASPCEPRPPPGTSFHPLQLRVTYEKALKNIRPVGSRANKWKRFENGTVLTAGPVPPALKFPGTSLQPLQELLDR